VPPAEQLRRTGRGWVDAGLTRVALMDAASTYYSIWTLLGETLEHVGRRAGGDIARREIRARGLGKDEAGFAAVVESLVQSGYGGLHVVEADLAAPRALVVCADSFEADAVRGNGGSKEPTCHLLRGLIAGLVEEMSGERNLGCTETSCAGRGDARCEFVVQAS
jgi:predicted hydrocarbon binding protein